MTYSLKNKVDLKDLEKLDDLQSKVENYSLFEKFSKQGFRYDVEELLEPITKTLTDTSKKSLEETRFNKKAIENLDESTEYVKTLESLNKTEVIVSGLIRSRAKLLIPKK